MSEEDVAQKDENLRMILRYQRAARDGVATKNLKLLAKIIRGSIEAGDMNADRCIYLLNIISEMTEEEIKLVCKLYKASLAKEKDEQISSIFLAENMEELNITNIQILDAMFTRITRTGLIVSRNSWDGLGFEPSLLFDELLSLVDLQEFVNLYGDEAI
jgi:hypothetical protein